MKKRQANIELARIVACFLVICIHTVTWYTTEHGLLENSLLIRCFLTDGVSVFWYIMGYFLFANPNASHTRRMKKTFTGLLLPAFAVMVFSQIWQDWILADFGEVSFLSCLDMHSFDPHNLFGNILTWNSNMTFGGHLWYIFTYVQVLLWAPLLSFVCNGGEKATKCRRYLMLLCALYIVNRDISNIFTLSINGSTYPVSVYTVINPTLLFVLIGYETYLHRDTVKKCASLFKWCGIICFIGFNLLKYSYSLHDLRIDTSDSYFLGISTVSGYLASYGLFLALLCCDFRPDSKTEKTVLHLGSKTLGIYLIHGCVFRKTNALGLRDLVYTLYTRHPENLLIEVVCTLVYAVCVFLICYLIVLALQFVKRLLVSLYRSLRSKLSKKPLNDAEAI